MANIKISELNEALSVSNDDLLVIVDTASNETKKVKANLVGGNIPIQDEAPENPEDNDLWIDSNDEQTFLTISDVVDSGTNSNGTYIKFGDGTLICHGTFDIGSTTTAGNQDGALYYYDFSLQRTYPYAFIEKPRLKLDIFTNEGQTLHYLWPCQKYNTSTATGFGEFRIYSPTNTTFNFSIQFVAIGRWKI